MDGEVFGTALQQFLCFLGSLSMKNEDNTDSMATLTSCEASGCSSFFGAATWAFFFASARRSLYSSTV